MCEYYFVLFFGVVYVGYILDKKIIGLFKIVCMVEGYVKRF